MATDRTETAWRIGTRGTGDCLRPGGMAALDGGRRLDGLALLAQEGRRHGLGLGAMAVRALGTGWRAGRDLTHRAGDRGRRAGRARDRDLAGVSAVVAGRPAPPPHRGAGRGPARGAHARARPAWRRLAGLLGDDPDAAAALALWNPPPFLTGCSQAAVLPDGPALIRNYDWDYRLFEAVVARTALTGRRVLGMLDCLWGLLDGINDAGLAISLAFGGRPQVGEGFGIPLVIRYVLETCGSTGEAMRTLRRLPVHMSYNVTTVDRAGSRATAYLAPDRPAHVTGQAVATNHQGQVEWAPYAAAIRTVDRQRHLQALLDAGSGVPGVVAACLRPPLYAHQVRRGVRHLVHRRVPSRRGRRLLPLARPRLAALAGAPRGPQR